VSVSGKHKKLIAAIKGIIVQALEQFFPLNRSSSHSKPIKISSQERRKVKGT